MTSLFQPVTTTQSMLDNAAICNGKAYFVQDTEKLFLDYQNVRTEIRDIIVLDSDSNKDVLLAPKNKFYFIIESSTLWLYHLGAWIKVSEGSKKVISNAVNLVAGNIYSIELNENKELNLSGWTANICDKITVYLNVTSSSVLTINFPDVVKWKNGQEPNLTTGETYILEFKSIDAGNTVLASIDTYTAV